MKATFEMVEILNLSNLTIYDHLKCIDFISKVDMSFPHHICDLLPKNIIYFKTNHHKAQKMGSAIVLKAEDHEAKEKH